MPFWYRPVSWWCWGLYPFSLLLWLISALRRKSYQSGLLKSRKSPLPVIVVGNISVGGNGKTPFVIWLCELLIAQGYKPGIVSRGYGGKSGQYPLLVTDQVSGKVPVMSPLCYLSVLVFPLSLIPFALRPLIISISTVPWIL
ncbi:tetraacyldisaccharide 4'-kinase [Psychromonas sp. MME2]|uniref:tetraacyldisaccharide 4'-kinase n=1 Tax=Psychromonas sp. MME2 TaxID=3231033 RepID=UPI00339CAB40